MYKIFVRLINSRRPQAADKMCNVALGKAKYKLFTYKKWSLKYIKALFPSIYFYLAS